MTATDPKQTLSSAGVLGKFTWYSYRKRQQEIGDYRMAYYMIATVKVNDDSWIPEYAANVHDIVHRHGGKYLSRSGNVRTLEGQESTTDLIALIEFPSEDALNGFMADPDYAPYAKMRIDGTDSQLVGIDATDAAETIPYLTVNS